MAISRRQFTAGALAGLAGYLPGRLEALRPRPKLFVFLIAEQFRQLYLDRGGSLLVPGGFRELMTKGVYYPDCRLAASGFTASGLATLATGAYPSLHGIVADQWYDRKTHLLTKARAEMLEATTLADEVERTGYREEAARSPQNRIFCLGYCIAPASSKSKAAERGPCWTRSWRSSRRADPRPARPPVLPFSLAVPRPALRSSCQEPNIH